MPDNSARDNRIVDLHTHSIRSDGTYTPSELLDYAVEKGLSAIALTDHDTVEGLDELHKHAEEIPNAPKIVDGIELSTEYNGRDVHIVGLFIDYKAPEFKDYLKEFQASRDVRNEKMCARLREGLDMDISYAQLKKEFPRAIITRAHYSRYMMSHGYTKSIKEAFERYIGEGRPYYVPRERITAKDGIDLIHRTRGIAVLAHPTLYHLSNEGIHSLIKALKEMDVDAMETLYTTYTPSETERMHEYADEFNLLYSGGSDFHGANKPRTDLAVGWGNLKVPCGIYDDLKKYHAKRYEL